MGQIFIINFHSRGHMCRQINFFLKSISFKAEKDNLKLCSTEIFAFAFACNVKGVMKKWGLTLIGCHSG